MHREFFLPFMQKAVEPIVVDGVLDEWNFCFPIDGIYFYQIQTGSFTETRRIFPKRK